MGPVFQILLLAEGKPSGHALSQTSSFCLLIEIMESCGASGKSQRPSVSMRTVRRTWVPVCETSSLRSSQDSGTKISGESDLWDLKLR